MNAPQVLCRNCGQPIKRCTDDYPAHRAVCNGWRHVGAIHNYDPRYVRPLRAEPEDKP